MTAQTPSRYSTGWLAVHAEDHDDGVCRCPCFAFVRDMPDSVYAEAHDAIDRAARLTEGSDHRDPR